MDNKPYSSTVRLENPRFGSIDLDVYFRARSPEEASLIRDRLARDMTHNYTAQASEARRTTALPGGLEQKAA